MLEVDLTGKVALVTGGNAGIGYETCLALYQKGAQVFLAGRDENRVQGAIERIEAQGPGGELKPLMLDLASLGSVRQAAAQLLEGTERLDLLVNNAGVMIPPASTTAEGYELQWGVNFLGHFLLTGLLYKRLESTAGARVVTLSSIAHRGAGIDFANFKLEKPYNPWREYGQSKLADLILALEFDKRLRANNCKLASLAAHPGFSKTELQKNMSAEMLASLELMTAAEGALPSLAAALSPQAQSGQYWGPDGPKETAGKPALAQVDPVALDPERNAKLWDWAQAELGLSFP